MNKVVAGIFAVAIMVASAFLAWGYQHRGEEPGLIVVKGLGSKEFDSDEILWQGTFTVNATDLKQGFAGMKDSRRRIERYLLENGLESSEFQFFQVSKSDATKAMYSDEGTYTGSVFSHYHLSQSFKVTSDKLDLVERLARDITELLNEGVVITSGNPEYYYSELETLKIDLIELASENGRKRAEQIASKSGAEIAGLKSARMGVFQIVGKNSGEDYSWGGTFNTSSRKKEALITVSMDFEVE